MKWPMLVDLIFLFSPSKISQNLRWRIQNTLKQVCGTLEFVNTVKSLKFGGDLNLLICLEPDIHIEACRLYKAQGEQHQTLPL